MSKINCFVSLGAGEVIDRSLEGINGNQLVNRIYLMGVEAPADMPEGCFFLKTDGRFSTGTIKKIADHSAGVSHSLLITTGTRIRMGMLSLERLLRVAGETGAGMVYSDYYDLVEEKHLPHPVTDYQAGSVRDDFEFGPVLLLNSDTLRAAGAGMTDFYDFAGLYQLRLRLSREMLPVRIQEFLYTVEPPEMRAAGTQVFDYVDPRNRKVQAEMEKVFTAYLREIDAYLEPVVEPVAFDQDDFPLEATVIIPVLNRVRTITDAVESVMAQRTSFDFNLIVVDNHSTDGTTALLEKLLKKHSRLIHVIPERRDLGIGGCWNVAVRHPGCGKFAVQLDSDDLYSDETALEQMVGAFYDQQCAMVVGSYRMVNFELEEIPPGIIDHREWTAENGHNNALRINGLGAPRAFYTPLLRKTGIPNVSYGEDYGVGLTISRQYRIGRIYSPVYLCRRWEDNSDASPGLETMNRFNSYKDRLRTYELAARIQMNRQKT
ncbi:MAG: glycosyltransferase family A protein [Bacteroidota bacterium]